MFDAVPRRKRGSCLAVFAVLGCLAFPLPSRADASGPYLPSWVARHRLEYLVDEAGLRLTTMQWPLPARGVLDALAALPKDLPPALRESAEAAKADVDRATEASFDIWLRTRGEGLVGFDDDYGPGSSSTLRSPLGTAGAQASPWLSARIGIRVEQQAGSMLKSSSLGGQPAAATLRLEETAVVVESLGVNLQAFAHRDWWGPGWQNSLILGDNAPPWIGVGLQRATARPSLSPLLSWAGPWNAEFFVAKAQDPRVIANQGRNFLFVGLRISLKPHSLVELGLSRTEQTAGDGRAKGWSNLWRVLTSRGANAVTPAEQRNDPGNGMAGFDVRVRCPSRVPCAGYAQAIGEDQAGYLPSHYLSLLGIESWSTDGANRWFAEFTNSTCRGLPWENHLLGCAYRNYQYLQGYTNGSRWAGASIGPDSRLMTLGWYSAEGERRLRVHWGFIAVSEGSYAPTLTDAPHGALLGASVDQAIHWRGTKLTGEAAWTSLSKGHDIDINRRRNLRVGITIERDLTLF